MTESLHYSPETITTLLIGYTPTQNKNLKTKKSPSNSPHTAPTQREVTGCEPGKKSSENMTVLAARSETSRVQNCVKFVLFLLLF